jgi:hypothetical protein
MQRSQLETALLAVGQVTQKREFILVGSQSIHAIVQTPPVEVLVSEECDVLSKDGFQKLEAIICVLGKGTEFHQKNGFFVDAVDPGILLLPSGWESRLKPMRLADVTAWCLEVNDLVVSKLNAGRLKDYEFINSMLRTKLAQFDEIVRLIQTLPDPHQQAVLLARLRISGEAMPLMPPKLNSQ